MFLKINWKISKIISKNFGRFRVFWKIFRINSFRKFSKIILKISETSKNISGIFKKYYRNFEDNFENF